MTDRQCPVKLGLSQSRIYHDVHASNNTAQQQQVCTVGSREAQGSGKAADDKDKEPLVLNYSYFVPERSDRMSAPAQRMTLPQKEQKK